jgi:hypothetical protein
MASMTAFLASGLAGLGRVLAFGLEVVHMEAQHVGVFDGVGDGVGVQLLLEQVFRGHGLACSSSICLRLAFLKRWACR